MADEVKWEPKDVTSVSILRNNVRQLGLQKCTVVYYEKCKSETGEDVVTKRTKVFSQGSEVTSHYDNLLEDGQRKRLGIRKVVVNPDKAKPK